jgi:hypothetical protein
MCRRVVIRQVTFAYAQRVVRHGLKSNHPHEADYAEENEGQDDRYGKPSTNH